MRVEPFSVGSVVHIIKRGARGMKIVRDPADRWRFVRQLYMLNDHFQDSQRDDHVSKVRKSDLRTFFDRPMHWPPRKPLVAILAWTLMPNHFHLLIQEVEEGGVSKFMQRFCGSMSLAFNEKYEEQGSLFQGAYKSKTIDSDDYLQYVHAYITVKNTFENFPGGLKAALRDFEKAWRWAGEKYPFSSFLSATCGATSPILDMAQMKELGLLRKDFKTYARSVLAIHAQGRDDFSDREKLQLEAW